MDLLTYILRNAAISLLILPIVVLGRNYIAKESKQISIKGAVLIYIIVQLLFVTRYYLQ